MTISFYIFIGMISFVAALTLGGLVYLFKKTICNCPFKCCRELEKEVKDRNMEYGYEYEYDMEVTSRDGVNL